MTTVETQLLINMCNLC